MPMTMPIEMEALMRQEMRRRAPLAFDFDALPADSQNLAGPQAGPLPLAFSGGGNPGMIGLDPMGLPSGLQSIAGPRPVPDHRQVHEQIMRSFDKQNPVRSEADAVLEALEAALGSPTADPNALAGPISSQPERYIPHRNVPPGTLEHLTTLLSGVNTGDIQMPHANMAQAPGYGPAGQPDNYKFVYTPNSRGKDSHLEISDKELYDDYQRRHGFGQYAGQNMLPEADRMANVRARAMGNQQAKDFAARGGNPALGALLTMLGGDPSGIAGMAATNAILGQDAAQNMQREARIASHGQQALNIGKMQAETERAKNGGAAPGAPGAPVDPVREGIKTTVKSTYNDVFQRTGDATAAIDAARGALQVHGITGPAADALIQEATGADTSFFDAKSKRKKEIKDERKAKQKAIDEGPLGNPFKEGTWGLYYPT